MESAFLSQVYPGMCSKKRTLGKILQFGVPPAIPASPVEKRCMVWPTAKWGRNNIAISSGQWLFKRYNSLSSYPYNTRSHHFGSLATQDFWDLCPRSCSPAHAYQLHSSEHMCHRAPLSQGPMHGINVWPWHLVNIRLKWLPYISFPELRFSPKCLIQSLDVLDPRYDGYLCQMWCVSDAHLLWHVSSSGEGSSSPFTGMQVSGPSAFGISPITQEDTLIRIILRAASWGCQES